MSEYGLIKIEQSPPFHEKEVHGQLAKFFYKLRPDGSLLVVEYRNPNGHTADSPSTRKHLEDSQSKSHAQLLAHLESGSPHVLELERRGTNAGVIPLLPTDKGLKIMFMIKNYKNKTEHRLDLPAGGPNGSLDLEKARIREVFGEEMVTFSHNKVILPKGHEEEAINFITMNMDCAKSLGLEVPPQSEWAIRATSDHFRERKNARSHYSQSISLADPQIPMGNLPRATVMIQGDDGRATVSNGFYASHRNGGDLLVPILYPEGKAGITSSIDFESTQKNRDEEWEALDRDTCAMTPVELRSFYAGDTVRVQTVTKLGMGTMMLNRSEIPICPLAEAFTELYLGIRRH